MPLPQCTCGEVSHPVVGISSRSDQRTTGVIAVNAAERTSRGSPCLWSISVECITEDDQCASIVEEGQMLQCRNPDGLSSVGCSGNQGLGGLRITEVTGDAYGRFPDD